MAVIFDTFDDEAGRDMHLNGRVATALSVAQGLPLHRVLGFEGEACFTLHPFEDEVSARRSKEGNIMIIRLFFACFVSSCALMGDLGIAAANESSERSSSLIIQSSDSQSVVDGSAIAQDDQDDSGSATKAPDSSGGDDSGPPPAPNDPD